MPKLKNFIISMSLVFALTSCKNELVQIIEPTQLTAPQGEVVLEVRGAISHTNGDQLARFDMAMLRALPSVTLHTSTSVTDGVQRFEGFLVRDFLRGLGAVGTTLTAIARNDYAIDIPLTDFEKFDVIIAYERNGKALNPTNKGPLWVIYPRDQRPELQDIRYDYRWVWQLEALEIK